jgi:DNA-binding NarL/FixJ family response regulator
MYNRQVIASAKVEDEKERIQEKMHEFRRMLVASAHDQENLLSMREKEVLDCVAEGKKRSQIAKELYVDLETVRSHIRTIFKKLKVHTKEDAVRVALENRYIGY